MGKFDTLQTVEIKIMNRKKNHAKITNLHYFLISFTTRTLRDIYLCLQFWRAFLSIYIFVGKNKLVSPEK